MPPKQAGAGPPTGTVETITSAGKVLVRTDDAWPIGATVLAGDRPIGRVTSVLGPVARPFAVVEPTGLGSDDLLGLVGEEVITRATHGGERKNGANRKGRS